MIEMENIGLTDEEKLLIMKDIKDSKLTNEEKLFWLRIEEKISNKIKGEVRFCYNELTNKIIMLIHMNFFNYNIRMELDRYRYYENYKLCEYIIEQIEKDIISKIER